MARPQRDFHTCCAEKELAVEGKRISVGDGVCPLQLKLSPHINESRKAGVHCLMNPGSLRNESALWERNAFQKISVASSFGLSRSPLFGGMGWVN